MKNTVEDYFQEAIGQYRLLEEYAQKLADGISTLKPAEILQKCNDLHDLQKKIATNDAQLIEMMRGVGSEVLEAPYTKRYQSALQKAITASDRVARKAKTVRAILAKELTSLKKGHTLSGYASGSATRGSLVQKRL